MSRWWKQRTFRVNKQKWLFERGVWQPAIREEHVLKEIVTLLWLHARIRLWRINCPVGGRMRPNERGIPDLIGYLPGGRFLAIEVKRPKGVRRPEQIQFVADAKAAGAVAFFAESWEDVVREFESAGIKLKREAA